MLSQADTDDENAVVLIDEDGLSTFGALPEDARRELTEEEAEEIERRMEGENGSFAELRAAATEILSDLGYGPVQWPLPDEKMRAVQNGETPQGLLLTRLPLNGDVETVS
jgi:hypothetical protein